MVEIGFTYLPKSGGGGRVPPASQLPTSLCWQVTIDRISRDIFFCNARIRTQFICTHYLVHIPVTKDCSKAQIERTFWTCWLNSLFSWGVLMWHQLWNWSKLNWYMCYKIILLKWIRFKLVQTFLNWILILIKYILFCNNIP